VSSSGVAAPLATSTPAPALGLLGTAVPAAGAPLVRPPFFVQNPLVLAGAAPALGAAVLGSPGLVVPPVVGAVEAIGPPSEFLLLKNMFDPSSEVSLLVSPVFYCTVTCSL
jgi:RNA-binding protein 39